MKLVLQDEKHETVYSETFNKPLALLRKNGIIKFNEMQFLFSHFDSDDSIVYRRTYTFDLNGQERYQNLGETE